jgi:DNA polymerase-3 subunit beta
MSEKIKSKTTEVVKFDREAIEDALRVASDFVDKKGRIPVLAHVKLEASKAQKECRITATDIETAWTATVPCSGDTITRCIPLETLYKEVKALPSDEDEVNVFFRKDTVSVNQRCEIYTMPADDFPAVPEVGGEELLVDGGLIEKLSRVVVAASTELDNRMYLASVLLDFGGGHMVGTDGHRMHIEDMKPVEGGRRLLIPRRAAALACKHGASSRIMAGEGHVLFRLREGEMATRLVQGEYPDYLKVVPDNPVKVQFSGAELLKVLEGALPLTNDNSVKLTINSRITIEGSSPERGHYRWNIRCEAEGKGKEKVVVGFKAAYLRDAIRAYTTAENRSVLMEIGEPTGACLINRKAVVMPMRVQ